MDESWLVRIRQTGYPRLEKTFSQRATAEAFVKKVEAERAQKIFIDYGKSCNTTFAELLVRYRMLQLLQLPLDTMSDADLQKALTEISKS